MTKPHDMDLRTVNVKEICLDKDRLGSLMFVESAKYLETARKILIELWDTESPELITEDEKRNIERRADEVMKLLMEILNFDLTQPEHNKPRHDELETRSKKLSEQIQKEFRGILTYLRQELALKNKDERKLQEELQAANKARVQSEETLKLLEERLAKINQEKRDIEAGKEEVGTRLMAKHFKDEADEFSGKSGKWLKIRSWFYWGIVIMLVVFAAWHWYSGWENMSWQEGAAKLAILSVLWYGVAFANRNYYVYSNLVAVNRHRAAVARTLEDYLEGGASRRAEMLKSATESMFKSAPIGFITKAEKESSPLLEIINKIVGPNG
jgi:hypothetical protein